MKDPCPKKVADAGANLVKCRRMAADLVDQIMKTRASVKAAGDDLRSRGLRQMELGGGLELLLKAAMSEAYICQAHNSFRALLGPCNVEEPSDDDIVIILGGGGGGR